MKRRLSLKKTLVYDFFTSLETRNAMKNFDIIHKYE